MNDTFRLVICVDIPADTLTEAYGKLYHEMGEFEKRTGIEWESTDEAFDRDGEQIHPSDMVDARLKFFETLPDDPTQVSESS